MRLLSFARSEEHNVTSSRTLMLDNDDESFVIAGVVPWKSVDDDGVLHSNRYAAYREL